jgi:branched-chain amino acid aminotransferase
MIVNLDGRFIPADEAGLPLNDGAVLFGDTLFETIKVRNGKALLADAHLDRLALSAALLDFPCDRDAIRAALLQTAARCPRPTTRLRLTLSRGICTGLQTPPAQNARVIITATRYREPDEAQRAAGAVCVFAPNRRANPLSHLPQMKRGNYADCLYAARHASAKGAREALFLDADGCVLEGATSNLFIIENKSLVTPEAGELVLAGIMRRQVLQTATNLGLRIEERPIGKQALLQADEAFLTNALIGILPIGRVGNTPLKRGPLALELLHSLDKSNVL